MVSYFLGACWPSLWSPESAQLLLGGWGLHLQVLWGDSDRPLPQGRQAQPRHPMDHKGCAQAQRDAWPDICRKEEPWPGQGPQVPSDHWRLPPCSLEEAQHPAAAPLSLEHANRLYKINILFMVTVLSCLVHSGVTGSGSWGLDGPYSDCHIKPLLWHIQTDFWSDQLKKEKKNFAFWFQATFGGFKCDSNMTWQINCGFNALAAVLFCWTHNMSSDVTSRGTSFIK